MKRNLFIFMALVLVSSCTTYNSIDSFYAAHKNDDQVTALRVPQFMLSVISDISPEMKALVGDTNDLRYMQFPSATEAKTKFLNNQMNNITGTSFIEVFRNNDNLKRNVISVREKRDVVKEILIYNNNTINGSFLYFNGNFDPVMVREMAQSDQFEKLSNNLVGQFNVKPTTPSIAPQD